MNFLDLKPFQLYTPNKQIFNKYYTYNIYSVISSLEDKNRPNIIRLYPTDILLILEHPIPNNNNKWFLNYNVYAGDLYIAKALSRYGLVYLDCFTVHLNDYNYLAPVSIMEP